MIVESTLRFYLRSEDTKKKRGKEKDREKLKERTTPFSKQARNLRSCFRRGACLVLVASYRCHPSGHPAYDVTKIMVCFGDAVARENAPWERYLGLRCRILGNFLFYLLFFRYLSTDMVNTKHPHIHTPTCTYV